MLTSEQKEKRILMLSFVAGLIMAVGELIFAVYSRSQSSMMDGIYDSVELIFIALILFLTPLFHKPISEKRPYGFFQVESIFLIIKGFMLLSVTVSVTANVIQTAISGGNRVNSMAVSVFQLVLGVTSGIIYLIMREMNESLVSPTVDAELLGWRLDICYSIGLSLAFFGSRWLEDSRLAFLAPYFDQIVAVLIVLFMLPESIRMLAGAIRDVFLLPPDEETVQAVKDRCERIFGAFNFESVFYDVTRTGRHIWVSVYFTTGEKYLELEKLRRASEEVDRVLSEELENCTCELIPMAPTMPAPDTVEMD